MFLLIMNKVEHLIFKDHFYILLWIVCSCLLAMFLCFYSMLVFFLQVLIGVPMLETPALYLLYTLKSLSWVWLLSNFYYNVFCQANFKILLHSHSYQCVPLSPPDLGTQLEGLSLMAGHVGTHAFAPNAGLTLFLHSALQSFRIIIPASGVSLRSNFIFV